MINKIHNELDVYDGLGDTVYCNCYSRLPPSHSDASALVSDPLFFCFDIKKCSIILDAPPCRLPLR